MSKKGSTRIWNEQNVAILKELFPTTPSHDIADIIGCSDFTVLLKAKQLGLKRDPSYNRNNFIGRYTGRGRYRKTQNYERGTEQHTTDANG